MAPPLVCFDIDGTLIRTRGAGREALDEAFLQLFGWPSATEGVNVAGATDDVICRDVAARFGQAWSDTEAPRLRAAYLDGLSRRLGDPARVELLPGLPDLLHALRDELPYCLLTGNWREGAERKMRAAQLHDLFGWGAFSEDAVDRDGLVPVARQRAAERGIAFGEVIVVGDTVSDVRCARAGGAKVIVVETGFSSPDALAAAGPDLQVADLAAGSAAVAAFLATCAEGGAGG